MSSFKLLPQIPAIGRACTALVVLACTALALTSCSSVASLPTLSESESVRDAIARSEQAILVRSSELAALATECSTCQTVLNEQAQAAAERLQTMGGMWEPWSTEPTETDSERTSADGTTQTESATQAESTNESSAESSAEASAEPSASSETETNLDSVSVTVQDGVATFTDESGQTSTAEIPDDLGEAPYTPAGLAAYMYATAVEQLQAASELAEIDSAQLTTYGAVLAGRINAAFELADAYGVDLVQAVQELPAGATATSVTEEMASERAQALADAANAETDTQSATTDGSGDDASNAASDGVDTDDSSTLDAENDDETSGASGASTNSTGGSLTTDTLDDSPILSTLGVELPDASAIELSEKDSQLIAEILLQLDCLAGSFQQAIGEGASGSTVSSFVLSMQQRTNFWVNASVSDLRNLRCEVDSTDVTELANQVIALDLQLFTSENRQLRLVGAIYLAQDAEFLAELGVDELVSPGV